MKLRMLSVTGCLSALLFGAAISASSAENACAVCYQQYDRCIALGTSEAVCETRLITCLRRGDGTHPCPL